MSLCLCVCARARVLVGLSVAIPPEYTYRISYLHHGQPLNVKAGKICMLKPQTQSVSKSGQDLHARTKNHRAVKNSSVPQNPSRCQKSGQDGHAQTQTPDDVSEPIPQAGLTWYPSSGPFSVGRCEIDPPASSWARSIKTCPVSPRSRPWRSRVAQRPTPRGPAIFHPPLTDVWGSSTRK